MSDKAGGEEKVGMGCEVPGNFLRLANDDGFWGPRH